MSDSESRFDSIWILNIEVEKDNFGINNKESEERTGSQKFLKIISDQNRNININCVCLFFFNQMLLKHKRDE